MARKRVFVGVSGFSYPGWKGKFYPENSKSEEFLALYSKRLNSVEVNSSFYAPPSTMMVKSWSSKTSEDFRFAFKAPRQITHILKLGEGSPEASERMSKTLDLLGPRRGPILFQLPPFARADLKLLEGFLDGTPAIGSRVFEFRHESWLQESTYELLEKEKAGFCIAETEDMAPSFKVTSDIAYFRLRKDRYDTDTVAKWTKKIAETAKSANEVYVYLRHDDKGENALLAEKLAGQL